MVLEFANTYAHGPFLNMQVLIITPHLLRGSMVSHALRRENISSLIFSPKQLHEEVYLSVDVILVLQNSEGGSLKAMEKFLYGFSQKIPILLLGANKSIFKDRDPLLIKRCILLENEFPFDALSSLLKELVVRGEKAEQKIKLGAVILDKEKRKLLSKKNVIQFTKKEYFLFELLLSNMGQIISRERIIDYVWDKRQYVGANTIDVYVSRLRKKLQISPKNILIRTIPCLGYEMQMQSTNDDSADLQLI